MKASEAALRRVTVFLLGFATQSCELAPTANDDDPASPSDDPPCEQWQDAFCAYDRECAGFYDCQTEIRSVICESDEVALECASALESASCDDPPDDCGLEDIADEAAARAACRTFIRALCTDSEACGQTEEQCIAESEASLNCSVVDVVAPSYDACIDELRAPGCSLPESCVGVFDDLI